MATEVVTVRLLNPGEYEMLLPHFNDRAAPLPHPQLSQIAGMFHGQQLVGFLCFQLLPHVEPLWIDEAYRDNGLWRQMAEMIKPFTEPLTSFIVADDASVEHMAKEYGFEIVEKPVYVKRPKLAGEL